MLITTGDTLKEIGRGSGPGGQSLKIGYKYSYGGIFWIDFWTWEGTYCVILGEKSYAPITQEQAAQYLGKSSTSISPPFLYRFPLGLLILGGVAVFVVIGAIVKRRESATTEALAGSEYESAK